MMVALPGFTLDPPLVAILRGVAPEEAVAIGAALFEGGAACAEVPLNSPRPLESIRALADAFAGKMLIGAGTVVSTAEVAAVRQAGAQLVVSPNCNAEVIRASKASKLVSLPGVLTPSEAFAALGAGADGLKLFPADLGGPAYVKALRAVLPRDTALFAVGGVKPENVADFVAAGVDGFGLGTALYKPGDKPEAVRARAQEFIAALAEAR